MGLIADAWNAINAEGSPLPLVLSLALWGSAFLYCHVPLSPSAPVFHSWDLMHNVHNGGAILIGALSLYFDDDAVFSERLTVFFNLPYFLMGLADNAIRRDVVYTFHDLTILVCGYFSFTVPIAMSLRIPSRMTFMELSSPLLYRAKRTRRIDHSLMFLLAFTVCRVLYVPFVIKALIEHDVGWTEAPIILLGVVYLLQVYWWMRMIQIARRMMSDKKKTD